MNKYAVTLAAAIAAATLAGAPAFAQTAADAFYDPRAEVTVGLDQLRFNLEEVGASGRGKASDLGYAATIGYDVALNSVLVAAVEVGTKLADTNYATSTGYLRTRREITLACRLGMPVSDNGLLYGKIGYADLRVRAQDLVANGKRHLDGVLLGAGAEVRISPNTYLKGEYRYTDYADGYVANNVMTGFGIRF